MIWNIKNDQKTPPLFGGGALVTFKIAYEIK